MVSNFALLGSLYLLIALLGHVTAFAGTSTLLIKQTFDATDPPVPWMDDCLSPATQLYSEHRITDGMSLNLDHPIEFSLDVDVERPVITLRGTLQIGVARALESVLEMQPCVTGIVLDSDGGNIYQARALAALVVKHELDTIVRDRCYSACTLVYVAGKRRILVEGASIGFHCYRLKASVSVRPGIDPVAEQEKDLRFFQERVPDTEFTEQIFRCHLPGLWLPSPQELIEAGFVHELQHD